MLKISRSICFVDTEVWYVVIRSLIKILKSSRVVITRVRWEKQDADAPLNAKKPNNVKQRQRCTAQIKQNQSHDNIN